MKLLFVALLSVVPVQDIEDEPFVMQPEERRFIVRQLLMQQQKIDELEHALRKEKDRTGCA